MSDRLVKDRSQELHTFDANREHLATIVRSGSILYTIQALSEAWQDRLVWDSPHCEMLPNR